MVNLLNLTAAASAASVMILDHTKSLGLDLVSGGCNDYNSIQQIRALSTNVNEKWNLNIVGANEFQIVSVPCGTILTYAGSETGANSIRSQPVAIRGSQTIWMVDELLAFVTTFLRPMSSTMFDYLYTSTLVSLKLALEWL
ncbi:hypothetical protein K435DRAFT_795357 [Dendrothele bispora CBS 962.96]|uniref:Uncharacterized protein n=1 Tax=Dendrothele bispora (strain CBS 962.96) TaxID=1314807 RepID=A0A4V4HGH8_DENBC|nr:hypothetical protein K435DRAFT_795357 [Dendrothele bispora CBS 962.96]